MWTRRPPAEERQFPLHDHQGEHPGRTCAVPALAIYIMQPGNESRCDVDQMNAENQESANGDHGALQGLRPVWRAPQMQVLSLQETRQSGAAVVDSTTGNKSVGGS